MKFAHFADVHIGAWRDAKLRNANMLAFIKAVDVCIEKQVDFILICGDLFNTSLPSIDSLRETVKKLKELKNNNIGVYVIAGSHDFSPSGKTIIDVLEHAGLLANVARGITIGDSFYIKPVIDKKTMVKITGISGRKGLLDKKYYEALRRDDLEKETGFKIFMFHTALTELKPKELERMESAPAGMLPKNFDYYAGGHVHIIDHISLPEQKLIVYPGPLFPNNFREIEELQRGGFYLVDADLINKKISMAYEPVQVYNTYSLKIDCNNKTIEQVEKELMDNLKKREFLNTIVTIRLLGTLRAGKISEINFRDIFSYVYMRGAYFVMKSTSMLKTKEFEEVKVDSETESAEAMEEEIIRKNIGQFREKLPKDEFSLVKDLLIALSAEKEEGERVADFENRIRTDANRVLFS